MPAARCFLRLALVTAALGTFPVTASAAVRHVPAAYARIGMALAAAAPGDTVLVAAGTYAPSTNGEAFPLQLSTAGVRLLGAGAGTTVLDAQGTAGVIRCTAATGGRVSGFSIRGGSADEGGGVAIVAGDVEVDHCTFFRNGASFGGAGLSARNGVAPWVHHCVFDSSFSTSTRDVHAIRLNDTVAGVVEHNVIAHSDGNGLLTVDHATTLVRGNVFFANGVASSPPRGRGICWLSDAPAQVAYNLFHANQVAALLWLGGGADFSATAANDYDASDGVHHNLDGDPRFVDAAGDYHLQPDSPAIDAADPSEPRDADGTIADIGPYPRLRPLGVPPRADAVAGSVAPNPLRDRADVRFVVPAPALVRVDVVDVGGRLVRTLARGAYAAGPQRVAWDGRDDAGVPVAPGVFRVSVRVGADTRALTVVRLR